MDFLVGRLENKLGRAWREMIRAIQDDNSLPELAARIAVGDTSGMLSGVADAAEKFALDINGGYVAAGQKTARWLDKQVDPAIRFDITSDSAIEWMTQHVDDFSKWVVQDQQATLERVISYGRSRGLSDMDIASEVQSSIGLNVAQVDVVETYRTAIETGDYSNAIDRALADGRYESALERADEAGTFIADDRVDAMVDAYRDNWVEFRGENVALHEAENATHAGVEEMLDQGVEADEIAAPNIQRTWHTRHDNRVRTSHRAMDGQVRGFAEPFRSGLGNELRYPGDEEAPDEDTAGCRCVMSCGLSA